MRFAQSLAALAVSLLSVVSATPVQDWKYGVGWDGKVLDPFVIGTPTSPNVPRTALVPRTPGGVYICTDINFSGTCGFAVQQLGQCIFLTSPWYQSISSFGPDPGATCFAYSQNSCNEAQWSFTYPGDATGGLGTSDPWNDRASRFFYRISSARLTVDDQITNFMCE
ncbi:hypothetical protein FB451DRAFT_1409418 [Mycena latifolia]|nr:hypothetical protein FB451DRAFT_1409418 [Mycena latifolia]